MSWNKVAVVGAGLIKMGELFDQSYEQMAAGAFEAAVASVDKGFEPHQVEAAFVATQRGTLWGQEGIGGNTIPTAIGLAGIPCTRIENACPSGSDAFRVGAMAVASGVHDVVLVIGVEKMRDKSSEEGLLSRAAAGHPIFTRGETAPVLFAPFATRHMHEFGTTREMLASVAVKNHYNGARDPYAHFQNEITVDDVLKSAPVCHPLHLLDCCPQTDGAAAVLLVPRRAGARVHRQARCTSPASASRPTTRTCTRRTASPRSRPRAWPSQRAYAMAGVGPSDIDCAEVHDCFTITEILDIEDLGFFEKGDGGRASLEGETALDRPHPGQHVAAACSPRATRSARPASPRSPSAGGSCAARPATARSRRATATRCSTTRAAAARASSVVNILTNRNDSSMTADRSPRRARRRRRRPHRPRPARSEERADDRRCATASSTRSASSAPIPQVRAVLITGDGDAFCAGMDLSRVDGRRRPGKPGFDPRTTSEALRAGVQTFIRELWELDKPTDRGRERRGGRARARTSRSRATSCSCTRAPASCGRSRSGASSPTPAARTCSPASSACRAPRRWSCSAKARPAPRPSSSGSRTAASTIPTRCCPRRSRVARKLAAGPTRSLGLSKRLLNASFETDLAQLARARRPLPGARHASPDLVEGMAAFREKRDAEFDGDVSESRPRRRVQRVAAYNVCVDDDDRGCCCAGSVDITEAPGSWTLPGGGIHFGEHPEAGALRELARRPASSAASSSCSPSTRCSATARAPATTATSTTTASGSSTAPRSSAASSATRRTRAPTAPRGARATSSRRCRSSSSGELGVRVGVR